MINITPELKYKVQERIAVILSSFLITGVPKNLETVIAMKTLANLINYGEPEKSMFANIPMGDLQAKIDMEIEAVIFSMEL